ncbi:MAG: SGNH/GDSL hydrolase family protein [Nitrospinaceae bacterium]
MKREWWLLIGAVSIMSVIGYKIIQWKVPHLLAWVPEIRLVVGKESPPSFYDSIFHENDAPGIFLDDPRMSLRYKNFYEELPCDCPQVSGPHDALGFRNRSIPYAADILTVGDSQTYGMNALQSENWPSQMRTALRRRGRGIILYNTGVGGWGGLQYLELFRKSSRFQPKVVVIAFYMGNDPYESFHVAYTLEAWKDFKLESDLSTDDLPQVNWPTAGDPWDVRFADGQFHQFNPNYRLTSNDMGNPAIRTGFDIMLKVVKEIGSSAKVPVLITIIPTKELVYHRKIKIQKLPMREDFQRLVDFESENIRKFSEHVKRFSSLNYVDVVGPLQKAALNPAPLYPQQDGHPLAAGYRVIGQAMAEAALPMLQEEPLRKLVLLVSKQKPESPQYLLVKGRRAWLFPNPEAVRVNGWNPQKAVSVDYREIASLSIRGMIRDTNPDLYGPLGNFTRSER